MRFMTYNDIHDLPDKGCDPQRARQMLKSRFNFSLPAVSELLASYSSPFRGEKSPKNSHLMIFMRVLLTDGVRVCHIKSFHTELATSCPCTAFTEIHNSETHWTSTVTLVTRFMTL